MHSAPRSTLIRHDMRRATSLLWAGYTSVLATAATLGLSVFALAVHAYLPAIVGLVVILMLVAAILISFLARAHVLTSQGNRMYLWRARRTGYLRSLAGRSTTADSQAWQPDSPDARNRPLLPKRGAESQGCGQR